MLSIDNLKNNDGEYYSIKQLEKSKSKIEEKLKRLNDQSKKDNVITFEQLGCDRLFIDEAHYFKNLFLFTKMRNVGGIAQTEAQKSSDLFMKCRYLDELTGGKGIVFATARFFSFSDADSFRKFVLKLPSISPSLSIYAPAIRVKEVRFGVIRLVSSSISSL